MKSGSGLKKNDKCKLDWEVFIMNHIFSIMSFSVQELYSDRSLTIKRSIQLLGVFFFFSEIDKLDLRKKKNFIFQLFDLR